MRFFTWKDIERYCLMNKHKWEKELLAVDVYPDEMLLFPRNNVTDEQAIYVIKNIFPKNVDVARKTFQLERETSSLPITIDREYVSCEKSKKPLFEQAIYSESVYPDKQLTDLPCPVIAFHSYKGGVGRTLSLLAFAKAWTNAMSGTDREKVLIVDSDIEAPGLSWMQGGWNEDAFSYLDLLTLIQDENDSTAIIDAAVKEIGNISITIETEQKKVEQPFLPTFRYDEQLFDIYASPDSVIKGRNKEYVLAEILAEIATRLGASAVFVDLRAGISEYSAPLLFDPRVKKYLVTSTSYQSIYGTEKLLQYIMKGLQITESANLPTILLSMVPRDLGVEEKGGIYTQLLRGVQTSESNESIVENMVEELPFASELVHLSSLKYTLDALKGREMYQVIERLVRQNYAVHSKKTTNYTDTERREILTKIHEFARKQITAEANGAVEMLQTGPIRSLMSKFSGKNPTTIIRGKKGAGKTFLYRQMLMYKDWSSFCESIDKKKRQEKTGFFLPVLAPKNVQELTGFLNDCIDDFNSSVLCAEVSRTIYIDNGRNLEAQMQKETDWYSFWEQLLSSSVNKAFQTFDAASSELKKENKKLIFLIDGLEEILKSVSSNEEQKKAVQVLCQDIVNYLSVKYDNLGIVVFLRSDMAQNAITVNYEQFEQAYSYAELKWSPDEAQKLAVWIVSQAVEGFYEGTAPIEEASRDVISSHLERLWGLKLGKQNSNEAYSTRWILAALSDFKEQIQARDIIRFLKYAAEPNVKKAPYDDRILMPTEIRNAVSLCSKDKISEIKMEYETLKPIFGRLELLEEGKKVLPLNLGTDALTADEEKLMMQEGYLTRDGDKLYLPEIVRHALGFKYVGGARPKVLSLLLKR